MVFDFLGFCLTFSAPERLKNSSFEMPITLQSLKITTSEPKRQSVLTCILLESSLNIL